MSDAVCFAAPLRVLRSSTHGAYFYVLIDGEPAETVAGHELMRRLEFGRRRGFGSVRVEARLGESRWSTSVFPTREGGWFLPIRKAVCRAEQLDEGEELDLRLELL